MQTEAQAIGVVHAQHRLEIGVARAQYRLEFKAMARGGVWNLYRGMAGVVLLEAPFDGVVLVPNVQGMGEQTMVNALSVALRAG